MPSPDAEPDEAGKRALTHALEYMGLTAGQSLLGQQVDIVFIGSCTNSRISDLREAADIFRGNHIADGLRVMVVPGSAQVKAAGRARGPRRRLHGRPAPSGARRAAPCASP